MTQEEIDQKVKELAEIDAKIQSSEFVSPADLRKLDNKMQHFFTTTTFVQTLKIWQYYLILTKKTSMN